MIRRHTFLSAMLLAAACATPGYAYQINATGGNPLTFGVGSTSATVAEKMRITSAGLIGIGTATPTTPLTVSGTISATYFVGDGSLLTNISGSAANLSETIAINDLSDASANNPSSSLFLGLNSGIHNTGQYNIAVGKNSLNANTTGYANVVMGGSAMSYNTTGYQNVAIGQNTASFGLSGYGNVAIGSAALAGARDAAYTVAIGINAGAGDAGNTNFLNGTFVGAFSGIAITTGNENTFLGYQSGLVINTGSNNTFLGTYAGLTTTTGSNNLLVGYNVRAPAATTSNFLNIGDVISGSMVQGGSMTFIGGIKAQGVVTATYFEGDGSRLTNVGGGGGLSETIAINDLSDATVSTTGYNMFLGAGVGALSTGGTNVGLGAAAMTSNTTGYSNVAVGSYAMYFNTTGNKNLAVGGSALVMNTTGKNNTALGASALYNNTTADDNTALGQLAMYNNVTGTLNVAIGSNAMSQNKSGSQNHAIGYYALNSNISGSDNVAIGTYALRSNKGEKSVGIGTNTGGLSNSTYNLNTLIGFQAGYALTAGSQNTFLGANAGYTATTGGQNIVIGYNADVPAATASSTLNIGNAISGSMLSGGSLTFIGGIKANGTVTATYFEGDGSRLTNVGGGGSSDRITSGTTYVVASSGGTVLTSGSLYINNAVSASDAALRIGTNGTGNHYAYIDMSGDPTYSGYGLRIIRYNTGANAASQIFHRGTGDFALYAQEAAPITFTTNSLERMRIDSSGNVGIGAVPSDILNVVTTTNGSKGLLLTNLSSGTAAYTRVVLTNDASNVAGMLFNSSLNTVGYAGANGLSIGTFTTGPLALYTSNAPRMTLTDTGLVGIGTTNPTSTLHISSTSPYGVILEGNNATTSRPRLMLVDTISGTVSTQPAWAIDNNADTFRVFRQPTISTPGTVGLLITSSTRVGMGTSTPSSPLTVNGEIASLNFATNGGQIRMIGGGYGAMWRNDGANMYLLLTDSGNATGAWNNLRPFYVNVPTGAVAIGTPSPSTAMALTVAGTVSATAFKGDGSQLTNINGTDIQNFTASGTWNKPAAATATSRVKVECWGGGGGGGTGSRGGGGGGGGYNTMDFPASVITASVAVTIGGGGAAGSAGTTTTFGTYLSTFGGGAGAPGNSGGGFGGGGGGGSTSVGGTGGAGTGTAGGATGSGAGGGGGANVGSNGGAGGGGGGLLGLAGNANSGGTGGSGGKGVTGGGGGGGSGNAGSNSGGNGGASVYGGGGGGGYDFGSGGIGGVSLIGGNGGDFTVAGTAPSGGGGANAAGARGECHITTYING